jgi:hypothetical protein
MSSFLPLGFTAPLVLAALLLLPVIWWLLRLIPPSPRRVSFPPARLLADIDKREETPDNSPWWLTLLRLLLAAAIILALAGPIWRPLADAPSGSGPLWIVLDNGWASSSGWETRRRTAERLVETAADTGRPVLLAATAEGADQPLVPQNARVALERLRVLEPRSWPANRGELTIGLRKAAQETRPGSIVWLAEDAANAGTARFVADLGALAGESELTVMTGLGRPTVLADARNDIEALTVSVRADAPSSTPRTIRALDMRGLTLGETDASFDEDGVTGSARFDFPVELRNDVARLELVGEDSAAGVQLLDDRWQRRTVGIVSGASADQAQPLLSPLYYLERALSPFAELRRPREENLAEALPDLIEQGVSVIVLADVGRLPEGALEAVAAWVEQGGVLVRFAGPRMAGGTDDLVPSPLRAGDRTLGGSLSWEQPQPLASFSDTSPFARLAVPADVTVNRQVLAEPGPDLADRTWASLADGTPLVTASARGRGTLVLFHVTADTGWSNLPISGTFVSMLRRIVALSSASGARGDGNGTTAASGTVQEPAEVLLPPVRVLDGRGRLGPPPASALPVSARQGEGEASRRHPPGLYGSDDAFRAINLFTSLDQVMPLDLAPIEGAATVARYPTTEATDLRPLLFIAALLLLFADAIAMMWLRGDAQGLRSRLSRGAAVLLLAGIAAALVQPQTARAQDTSDDLAALEATLDTRLAYVLTGQPDRDATSRQGLLGLTRYISTRTALEPEAPVGVDIATDELAFYPVLYWPISETTPVPSPEALARIDTYMRNGGTILFDTADQLSAGISGFGTSPSVLRLRQVLDGLDIPPLEPVPADHVLTKAFYLLESFPGRYADGPLWVEATETQTAGDRPVRAGDGVSPLLITGNDFAAAWAVDEAGNPLFPTIPNDAMQREYAYRSGVNIVMYALTGNYKADQVHVPALLERLGQ